MYILAKSVYCLDLPSENGGWVCLWQCFTSGLNCKLAPKPENPLCWWPRQEPMWRNWQTR